MQLLNTLYVNTPDSYLRLDNDTLRVQVEEETRLRVPLHHLQAVVCFGRVGLSVPLMHRLADEAITLVLLDDNGRFKARLEGAVSGNVLLRRAQHSQSMSAVFSLAMARACVAGKVKNTRQVLLRGARDAKAEADVAVLTRGALDLAATLRALPEAATLDVRMSCVSVVPRCGEATTAARPDWANCQILSMARLSGQERLRAAGHAAAVAFKVLLRLKRRKHGYRKLHELRVVSARSVRRGTALTQYGTGHNEVIRPIRQRFTPVFQTDREAQWTGG